MKTNNELEIKIRGIAPLLMHNGQTKDPMNEFSKAIKKVSSKRNKTDDDYLQMSKLEWHASIYVNGNGKLIIPSDNIEACIIKGGMRNKNGKKLQSGMWLVENPGPEFNYTGPKDIDKLSEDPNFISKKAVKIKKNSVIRTRPIFNEWWLIFHIGYNPLVVNEEEIIEAIENAGRYEGLGDYRPKYGRFIIED